MALHRDPAETDTPPGNEARGLDALFDADTGPQPVVGDPGFHGAGSAPLAADTEQHADTDAATAGSVPLGPLPPVRPRRRGLAGAAVAVGAVVVAIAAVQLVNSGDGGGGLQLGAGAITNADGSAPSAAQLRQTAPPSGGASAPGATSGSATGQAAGAPPGAGATPGPARVAAGSASVTVLDQTGVPDLGATVAQRISSAGWAVRRVTSVAARVQETTVFYDRSQQAQAALMLRSVPTVRRMLPRPRWLLRTGGLIVVVARDAV